MYGHFVVAVLWSGCVAVALWRYCGAVALCCSAFWCGGTRLYFAQWRPSRVYILHNGMLATFTFLHNGMLATFTFLHNGIHVCVFAQWYSIIIALKMQAFCFKWLTRVICFTNFVKTNAIR